MRLIFDARHVSLTYTGLGRYTRAVLDALMAAPTRADLDVVALLHRPGGLRTANTEPWSSCDEGRSCQVRWVDERPFSLGHYTRMAGVVDALEGDFYFYPHFDVPLRIRTPTIFVVHDLLPLLVEGYVQRHVLAKKAWFKFALQHSLARAQRCYAVSETTRRDILRVAGTQYEEKVRVTVEGPMLNATRAVPLASSNAPFLLYVGDRRPHKNLKRLLDVFRELKRQHAYPGELHLVGARKNYDIDVEAYAEQIPAVKIKGPLPDHQLALLYGATDGLIMLSKYEGFGLPVVEAAAMGARVIVSDGGSLPEIAPPQRCLVPDALSAIDAAAAIADFLARPRPPIDPGYLEKYSWDHAVRSLFPFAFEAAGRKAA